MLRVIGKAVWTTFGKPRRCALRGGVGVAAEEHRPRGRRTPGGEERGGRRLRRAARASAPRMSNVDSADRGARAAAAHGGRRTSRAAAQAYGSGAAAPTIAASVSAVSASR
jgi:hypothetical protein